jgi:hypothetical protein
MSPKNTESRTAMEDDFKRQPFAVGPDHLTKIREILQRKVANGTEDWFVTRSDGFQLRTTDFDELLVDERLNDEPLTRIELSFELEDEVSVNIDFRSNPYTPVSIKIDGSNHDEVLLLTSALRKYIRSEVLVRRPPKWIGSIVVLALTFGTTIFILRSQPPDATFESVLQSHDINEKLNYLLQHNSHGGSVSTGAGLLLFALFVYTVFFAPYFLIDDNPIVFRQLYPRNVFLFGPTGRLYQKRVALRNKLLWSGVIAIAASIVAGIVLKLVT